MSESKPTNENTERITIKKSTFNIFIVGIIIAVAAATFVAGFLLGSSTPLTNSDYITKSDFEDTVGKLASKLDNIQIPTPTGQPTAPSIPSIIKVSVDDDPFKGNQNAPVTIVEFSDFQCPFCKKSFDQTEQQLLTEYVDSGKAKFVYRDLPLESLHPNARSAALAAECADEQGTFWDFHDKLFNGQSEWSNQGADDVAATFVSYANDLKMDSKKFEACYISAKYSSEVAKDAADAAKYGVTGTPTFFIGNEKDGFVKLVGAHPLSALQAEIDRQLG